MRLALALLAAGLAAGRAAAQAPELKEMAPRQSAPGWTRQGSSLLLYGADGSLAHELPLQSLDESANITQQTTGGVSPDGRLAWTLERRTVWNASRTKALESRRAFRLHGDSGRELWRDDWVDAPERGEPVAFSADSKHLLIARRLDVGWQVELRGWMGAPAAVAGPFSRLISMALTPNARFLLARWAVPDKSDTHTFIDVRGKRRKDVPSSELTLGLARIDDEGVVRSGAKTIYRFEPAPPAPEEALKP